MFAASLTRMDSEKLKQATIIIEKFIELFKHIKVMEEIKTIASFTTPEPPKATLKELLQLPQVKYPVIMQSPNLLQMPQVKYPILMHPLYPNVPVHNVPYIPPSPFNMKLQQKSSSYDMLDQQNLLELMLQARRRALDIQSQSSKPQHIENKNAQASKSPFSFDPKLNPQFPFDMKQPPKISPVVDDPYDQSLQPLPFHVNQHNNKPNKINKSVTIRQTEVGAIAPIQIENPVGLNNNFVLSSPIPLGLSKDENNRWNIMIKYGKSQAEINDLQNRKHLLSTYSNMPNNTVNYSREIGRTQQKKSNNNVPLFKQDRIQYIDDFRVDINPQGTSTAIRQDSVPQLRNNLNISNSDQPHNENTKDSNLKNILAEVEKIAKVFGYKSETMGDENKSPNKTKDVNDQIHNNNAENAFEEILNNKKNSSMENDYKSKLNYSKLDPRILHLNQMAHIVRENDKEGLVSNVFKRVYTPKNNNIYTRRKSPDKNFAYNGSPNLSDNIMVAIDSIKNKEYREKGISFNRRLNSDDTHVGNIPVGYHEKLERFEERSQYKDKDWQRKEEISTPDERPVAPIGSIKTVSNYNDAPFQNFLKTQQKVNNILERILATRTDDAARSIETI